MNCRGYGIVIGWIWWGKRQVNRGSKFAARHSVTLGLDQYYLSTAERRQLFFPTREEEFPPGGGEHYASDGEGRVVVGCVLGRRVLVMAPALLAFFLLCRWMGRPHQWKACEALLTLLGSTGSDSVHPLACAGNIARADCAHLTEPPTTIGSCTHSNSHLGATCSVPFLHRLL